MAFHPSRIQSVAGSHPMAMSVLLAVVLVSAVLVLTAVFEINATGPSFEIVPDPAGTALPF